MVIKKMTIELLDVMDRSTNQPKKYWYATDYTNKQFVVKSDDPILPHGWGYACYLLLDTERKAIQLDENKHKTEVKVILDKDGYAYIFQDIVDAHALSDLTDAHAN